MKYVTFFLVACLMVILVLGAKTTDAEGVRAAGAVEAAAPIVIDGTVVDSFAALTVTDEDDEIIATHLYVLVNRVIRGRTSTITAGKVIEVTIPGGTVGTNTMTTGLHSYIPTKNHKSHFLLVTTDRSGVYAVFGGEPGTRRIS